MVLCLDRLLGIKIEWTRGVQENCGGGNNEPVLYCLSLNLVNSSIQSNQRVSNGWLMQRAAELAYHLGILRTSESPPLVEGANHVAADNLDLAWHDCLHI